MSSVNEKSWTVMVYFAADNNLSRFAVRGLKQMMQVGSSDAVNLVAQIDRRHPAIKTKRYFFQPAGTNGAAVTPLEQHVVETLPGETNTGDPADLRDFIVWAGKRHPATRLMVVLWGHGMGAEDRGDCRATNNTPKPFVEAAPEVERAVRVAPVGVPFGPRGPRDLPLTAGFDDDNPGVSAGSAPGIGDDDDPGDFLNNHELKSALREATEKLGRRIDVLGMDACLMSMVEVACQVRESADLMVASEETEPSDSWPYHVILKKLVEAPSMTPEQLASTVVSDYVDFYVAGAKPAERGQLKITQSACDLRKLDRLNATVSELGEVLRHNLLRGDVRKAIHRARRRTQAYYFKDFVDLFDFCEKLPEELKVATFEDAELVRERCRAVRSVINEEGFVVSSKASDNLRNGSHGVSIYFPAVSDCYSSLDFPGETQWGDFLHDYVSGTLRRGAAEVSGNGDRPAETTDMVSTKKTTARRVGNSAKAKAEEVKTMKVETAAIGQVFETIDVPVGSRITAPSGKVFDVTGEAVIEVPSRDDFAIKLPVGAHVTGQGTGADIKVAEGTSTKVAEGTSTKVEGGGAEIEVLEGEYIELPEGTLLKLKEGATVEVFKFEGVAWLEPGEETLAVPEGTRLVKTPSPGSNGKGDPGQIGAVAKPQGLQDEVTRLRRMVLELMLENDRLKEKLGK